jgi:hypothetical protein
MQGATRASTLRASRSSGGGCEVQVSILHVLKECAIGLHVSDHAGRDDRQTHEGDGAPLVDPQEKGTARRMFDSMCVLMRPAELGRLAEQGLHGKSQWVSFGIGAARQPVRAAFAICFGSDLVPCGQLSFAEPVDRGRSDGLRGNALWFWCRAFDRGSRFSRHDSRCSRLCRPN